MSLFLFTDASFRHPFERGIVSGPVPFVRDGWQTRNDFEGAIVSGDRWRFALVAGGTMANDTAGPSSRVGQLLAGVTAVGDVATVNGSVQGLGVGIGYSLACEAAVRIATLSDGTDNILVQCGFGDAVAAGTDHADAVMFENDRGTNGTNNWFALVSANSVRTRIDLGVAPTAATYDRLSLTVDAAGTVARFFVNGALRLSQATGIPGGNAQSFGPMIKTEKRLGPSNRTATWDYIDARADFSTRR